ncbi:MAG: hypothetical protein GY696_39315, partial [Gammaproteobacteria bacterium]|nr:hypothetical protein [Gammaproteobacteria bacterium]
MEQLRRNIVEDEHLKRVVCATVLTVYGSALLPKQEIGLNTEDVEQVLQVYFCGTEHEPYTTVWLKSDANHKFPDLWRGDNALGDAVKDIIVQCWSSFRSWYDTMRLVDSHDKIEQVFTEAKELAEIWYIRGNNFAETKRRVQSVGWGVKTSLSTTTKNRLRAMRKQEEREKSGQQLGDTATPAGSSVSTGSDHNRQGVSGQGAKRQRTFSRERARGRDKSADSDSRGSRGYHDPYHPTQMGASGVSQSVEQFPSGQTLHDQAMGGNRYPGIPPGLPPPGSYYNKYTGQSQAPMTSYIPSIPIQFPTPMHPASMPPLPTVGQPRWAHPNVQQEASRGAWGSKRGDRGKWEGREVAQVNLNFNMDKLCTTDFQEKRGHSDTRQRESNLTSDCVTKAKITSDVPTGVPISPSAPRYARSESPSGEENRNVGGIPTGFTTPVQLPRRTESGSCTPEVELQLSSGGSNIHGRIEIDPKSMDIVTTKDKSRLIPHINSVDDELTVNVARCDDWTQKIDKSTLRCGRFRQHVDIKPLTKIMNECFIAMTWKGKRIITPEYRAERPLNFRNVALPKNFCFRYTGLDRFFAELFGYGLFEPCINMGYIGDSTMIKIRQWLMCWEQSHNCTDGAVRFSDPDAQHLRPGIKLYDLTDFKLEDQFRKADVVIIKTQVDFVETWHYLAGTDHEGEAISCIIRDYR